MTRNQIENAKHMENVRHNIATEGLTAQTLAETIANNLRNYKVNISKNRITALANDKLDQRERGKLAEEIRNNLQRNLETQRHNLADEEIRNMQNAINSLKSKYQAGPIIAAILGLMPDDDVTKLYGSKAKAAIDALDILDRVVTKPEHPGIGRGKSSTSNRIITGGQDDEDEIPTDFSSSKGPKGKQHPIAEFIFGPESGPGQIKMPEQNKAMYNQPIGPNFPIANRSDLSHTSNVIYHPSIRKKEYGPGFNVPGINY